MFFFIPELKLLGGGATLSPFKNTFSALLAVRTSPGVQGQLHMFFWAVSECAD